VTKLRRRAVILLTVFVLPAGTGLIGVTHAAIEHDHQHEVATLLQTALHGHAHDETIPAHDHVLTSPEPPAALRVASLGTTGNRIVAAVGFPANELAVPLARVPRLIEAQGAGPPSVLRQSPVLRI
jgi:hypothetical protein